MFFLRFLCVQPARRGLAVAFVKQEEEGEGMEDRGRRGSGWDRRAGGRKAGGGAAGTEEQGQEGRRGAAGTEEQGQEGREGNASGKC